MKYLNIILRYIFSWIDAITAKLITTVYRVLTNLSELILYSDDMVKVIGKRIGLILGIFMLFRLAISLINYMISPDKIKDGKQGGGKLIINVGISLALLISINFIFKEAYRIQGIIVNSRIIERIFFGNAGRIQSTNDNTEDSVKMDIGYYLYTGFIYPNTEVFGDTCDDLWDTRFDITVREVNHPQSCDEMLHDKLPDDARKSIYKAKNTLDMSYVFFEYDLISSSGTYSDVLDFDYTPIISNAAGIIVLLVLISFSMDLATRAVKLLFLQIIAPIPIISFMDTGKGQDIFKKWGKECINTYLSVFIRLIAINFAVFMIVLIRGNYKNVFVNNVWLNIFLIIGCLMFAKQIPKLIEEFLGIKLDGMSLKPLKKFEENALLGKNVTGAVSGLAIGGVGNTISLIQEGHPLQAALFGMTGGAFRGLTHGLVEGKGLKDQAKRQAEMNQKIRQARLNDTTFLGRMGDNFSSFVGAETPSERFDRKSKSAESRLQFNQANLDYAKSTREAILDDLRTKSIADLTRNGTAWVAQQANLRAADAAYQAAQQSGNEADIIRTRNDLAAMEDSVFESILNSGQESARMKADREKFNVRVKNNVGLAKDAGVTFQSRPLTKNVWDTIKGNSQKKVNEYESKVYEFRNSSKASKYQGDRTYNDATSFRK